MYEQPKTSAVGRIVWFVISLLIIAGIVWLILWFFFWREPGADNKATKNTAPSTQQSAPSASSSQSGSSRSSGNANTSSGTKSTPSPTSLGQVADQTAGTTATELANTGPGDLVTPVILAVAGGVIFYQVRLRRERSQDSD